MFDIDNAATELAHRFCAELHTCEFACGHVDVMEHSARCKRMQEEIRGFACKVMMAVVAPTTKGVMGAEIRNNI
jgi:hypothetical protein